MLGRDAIDGEVVLGLTMQLTGIDDWTVACVTGELSAERDEKRVERSRNEWNFSRKACQGRMLGRRWWFWGKTQGAKVSMVYLLRGGSLLWAPAHRSFTHLGSSSRFANFRPSMWALLTISPGYHYTSHRSGSLQPVTDYVRLNAAIEEHNACKY